MIKKCEWCGQEFETNRSIRKFCSRDCKNKHQNEMYHSRKVGLEPPPISRTRSKKVNQNLIDLTVKARESGMTYGQYIARMEGGMK